MAIIYGQIRKSSRSVWPDVVMHGMTNALGFAIPKGNLIAYSNEWLGSIATGGLTITVIYGLVALILWARRK